MAKFKVYPAKPQTRWRDLQSRVKPLADLYGEPRDWDIVITIALFVLALVAILWFIDWWTTPITKIFPAMRG